MLVACPYADRVICAPRRL